MLPFSVFILNFIFYSVVKKRYNFETYVLFYGAGFTSCCITFVFLFTLITHFGSSYGGNIEAFLCLLYIIPFTTLYYSYATLLQNKEKDADKITLSLAAITVLSFVILIIFETIKYQIPYVGVFLLLYGLYLVYCLVRKKGILDFRGFAWSPFIPSFIACCYVILISLSF